MTDSSLKKEIFANVAELKTSTKLNADYEYTKSKLIELVKIFDVSKHQIYAETYRNYVEDMTGTTVEDWVAQPEFVDWLNKVTEISGHEFYTYNLDQYKA